MALRHLPIVRGLHRRVTEGIVGSKLVIGILQHNGWRWGHVDISKTPIITGNLSTTLHTIAQIKAAKLQSIDYQRWGDCGVCQWASAESTLQMCWKDLTSFSFPP